LVFIVHHYFPHPALRATFPQGKALCDKFQFEEASRRSSGGWQSV